MLSHTVTASHWPYFTSMLMNADTNAYSSSICVGFSAVIVPDVCCIVYRIITIGTAATSNVHKSGCTVPNTTMVGTDMVRYCFMDAGIIVRVDFCGVNTVYSSRF
jgi:hypothetical protein